MAGDTFGKLFQLTTFGESHGPAIGGIIDGCPPGIAINEEDIQTDLDLRRPGAGATSTKRRESDTIRLLSGVLDGITTGTAIGFVIQNENQHSGDYSHLADVFRPGHADWSYFCKYNGIRDYRGGGRASGRETACRVAGGAVAKAVLKAICGAEIQAACIELGGIAIPETDIEMTGSLQRAFFSASENVTPAWNDAVEKARKAGDTLGGIVRIVATGIPAGLGNPVFDKLDATLALALMSVGAVKGVEIGAGFRSAKMRGSENNDLPDPGGRDASGRPMPVFRSNNAGGILGGISTGQPIVLQAAIKPIASIDAEQEAIDREGNRRILRIGGRHDLSAIPRVVPVLAAMTALALADALLQQKGQVCLA